MSSRWVYFALLAYVLGFALFPPRVFLIVDEERYVDQAVAFAHGARTLEPDAKSLPVSPANVIHDAPPGTSVMQTPFVAVGGWRAAALASVLALIVATLATMRWIRDSGRHPAFALIVPGFAGTLFFARIGMSDVPAAALVALTMWLLFRTDTRDRVGSFAAGVAAGALALFREPPLLLVVPAALASIVRRRCATVWMIAGGITGIALRLIAYKMLLGSAFYLRDPLYRFSLRDVAHGLPMYAGILLIMAPAGALLPLFYRGPRRLELTLGFLAYVALFVFYGYDAARDNGLARGIILSSRYMIPAMPLLAFMAAAVVSRAANRVFGSAPAHAMNVARAAAIALAVAAFAIHPLIRRQEAPSLALVRDIFAATDPKIPIVTNTRATLKFLSPSYGPRIVLPSYRVKLDSLATLARNAGAVDVVLLDRLDGAMFRGDDVSNARMLADIRDRCTVARSDKRDYRVWGRLYLLRLSGCGSRVLPYAVQ